MTEIDTINHYFFRMKSNKREKNINKEEKNYSINLLQYAILFVFVVLYVYNIFSYFWTFAEPSDSLQYLGTAVWKTTWGYWPWLDRIGLAVNLRIFTMLFSKGYEAGMYYMGFVSTAILVLSMFWAFRKSGFWAAFFVGVFINTSYLTLGWSLFIFPDQTVALYSLLAFVFYFWDVQKSRYIKPNLFAGFFVGLALFTKATGVGILAFLLFYTIYKRDWGRLKFLMSGIFISFVLTIASFIILYNWESFWNVYGLFFRSSISKNLDTNKPIFTASYFQELLLAMKYFPYMALFLMAAAYKNEKVKNLFLAAWSYIILLMILRSAGPTIPSYIYSAYIFTVLGFSIYLSDLLAESENERIYKNKNFITIISLLVFGLISLGLKYGFVFSPVEKFDYDYLYLKPIDIYTSGNLIYPVIVKKLYSFIPMVVLAILVYIEFSKSKKAIVSFVVLSSFWFSFSNGGLAFQKAKYDRERAGIYYEIAPLLNKVEDKQFSVYIKELNKYPCTDCLLWLYRIFFDEKYQRVFEEKYKSQYLNEYQVTGNIGYIEKEEDLLSKIKGNQIITDDPDSVLGYFPSATETKQVYYRGGQKKLYIMNIPEISANKNVIFNFEDNFSNWQGGDNSIGEDKIEKALPNIKLVGWRGNFGFDLSRGEQENILKIKLTKPHDKEKSEMNFGYFLEGNYGLKEDSTVYFSTLEVLAKSKKISAENDIIFIQDRTADGWEKVSASVSESEWKSYSLTKKLRKGSNVVVLGASFFPESLEDNLEIKDIKISVWTMGGKK